MNYEYYMYDGVIKELEYNVVYIVKAKNKQEANKKLKLANKLYYKQLSFVRCYPLDNKAILEMLSQIANNYQNPEISKRYHYIDN